MLDWALDQNLDWAGFFASGVTAVCFFVLHVISSPKKKHWMKLPGWVRLPFFIVGGALLYRAADLLWLAIHFPDGQGHVTITILIAQFSLAAAMTAMTVHATSMAFNPRVWSTINWITDRAACGERKPKAALQRVMKDVAVEELRDAGATVAGPREGGAEWVENLEGVRS